MIPVLESSNGQLKKFLFLVTAVILNGGGAVGHKFERDPPRDHPSQVWFNLVQRFQRRRFKLFHTYGRIGV
jgi:hypothetical protein